MLQACRSRDKFALCQILPTLIHCENERASEDTFLHTIISYLIPMAEDFSQEDLCVVVFDDFILPSISKENMMRHLLRLLWHIHHKLPPTRLEALMQATAPNNEHSEAVHTTYQQLADKISSYEPSPATPQEQLDSPLMSVPAPTPAPY
ncbi:negative elongation factor B-like [Mizuhopecten yessoensis]|uniref:negative elongation factor B-like n=1 Tax=Mizuhopecten yessoensis TaxID=6573 RepID=UPI000B45E1A2|nr:negative elongation factor B-like [Mizuhopecten yessoensis]